MEAGETPARDTLGIPMDKIDQAEYWNGDAGKRWVEFSERLDGMLAPFADAVLERANITANDDVLDVGCGAGILSQMAAKKANSVLGLDISEPLIAHSKIRAAHILNIDFMHGDAGTVTLNTPKDLLISRFGVMFFEDPIAAFSNLRTGMKSGGRLVFACWQAPNENMWAMAPLQAAVPFFKEAPTPPNPRAPGPFAFADPDYVTEVLTSAGWKNVGLHNWRGTVELPGDDVAESASFMMEMGPLSRIMKAQDIDKALVEAALISKLSEAADDAGRVNMSAAVWIVSADA